MPIFLHRATVIIIIVAAMQGCHCVDQRSAYPCGEPTSAVQGRVTYGWNAESSMWPWHAAIFRRGTDSNDYICGATLIGRSFVVTAAHCVINRATGHKLNPNLLTVHFGRQYLNESSEWVQEIAVEGVVMYPEFLHGGLTNDIALLSLKTPVQFNKRVLPICLSSNSSKIDDLEGRDGVIVGWGKTETGHVSMTLQTARLPVIDYVAYLNSDPLFYSRLIYKGMFCAGYENGTSVCNGDSGGGMFFRKGKKWVLRGIVSFSALKADRISCDFHKYAGFTNVCHYIPWIQNITKDGISFMDTSNYSEMGISPKIHACTYDANKPLVCQLSNVHLALGSNVSFHANNKKPTVVSVRRSYLQFLPKSLIDAFPAMEYLNLENLGIQQIELEAFHTATNLLSIDVHMNRLKEISHNTFSAARSMMQLNLSNNQIDFIDEFALNSNSRLKNLDVSNNRITRLPTFSSNRNLETINASHNFLTEISDVHFVNNRQLHTIGIANNRLTYLDLKQLDVSTNLNTIDLSFNKLKRLHIPQHVKHLFVHNNFVENVSAGKCVAETLNLATNSLQSYLDVSNCTSLMSLDLSNNHLQSFSYGLIARMQKLQYLYLSNNRILDIDQPLSVIFRSKLKVLDISHNRIIHVSYFKIFDKLEIVKLNHNELQYLDFSKMTHLQKAYLSSNQWDCNVLQNIPVQSSDGDPNLCGEGFRKAHGICCKDYKHPYGDMFAEIIRNEYIRDLNTTKSLKKNCLTPVSNRALDQQIRESFIDLSTMEKKKLRQQADLSATLQVRFELSKTHETITASYQSLRKKTSEISRIIRGRLILESRESDLKLLQKILASLSDLKRRNLERLEDRKQNTASLSLRILRATGFIHRLKHNIEVRQRNLLKVEQEEQHLVEQHGKMVSAIEHRNDGANRFVDASTTHTVHAIFGSLSASQVGGFSDADEHDDLEVSDTQIRGYSSSQVAYSGSQFGGHPGSQVRGYAGSQVVYSGSQFGGFPGSQVGGYSNTQVRGHSGSQVAYSGSQFGVYPAGHFDSQVGGYSNPQVDRYLSSQVGGYSGTQGGFYATATNSKRSILGKRTVLK